MGVGLFLTREAVGGAIRIIVVVSTLRTNHMTNGWPGVRLLDHNTLVEQGLSGEQQYQVHEPPTPPLMCIATRCRWDEDGLAKQYPGRKCKDRSIINVKSKRYLHFRPK